jgi:hypothetical protein
MEDFSIERAGVANLDFTGELIGQSAGPTLLIKIYRSKAGKHVGETNANLKWRLHPLLQQFPPRLAFAAQTGQNVGGHLGPVLNLQRVQTRGADQPVLPPSGGDTDPQTPDGSSVPGQSPAATNRWPPR